MNKKIFSIFVSCIFIAGAFTSIAGKDIIQPSSIAIIYDESESIPKKVAFDTYNIISNHYYTTKLISINNYEELKNQLAYDRLICVYFFHGDTNGMKINDENIAWSDLKILLKGSPTNWHIVESCSSILLGDIPNVYSINIGVDIELSKIHAIDRISNILHESDSYIKQKSALKIREYFDNYVIDHYEELITRVFAPIETLNGDCSGLEVGKEFQLDITANGVWGWVINQSLKALNKIPFLDVNQERLRLETCLEGDGIFDNTSITHGDLGLDGFPFDIPLDIENTYDVIEDLLGLFKTIENLKDLLTVIDELKDLIIILKKPLDEINICTKLIAVNNTINNITSELVDVNETLDNIRDTFRNIEFLKNLLDSSITSIIDILRAISQIQSTVILLIEECEEGIDIVEGGLNTATETYDGLLQNVDDLVNAPLNYLTGENTGLNLFFTASREGGFDLGGIESLSQILSIAGYELSLNIDPEISVGIRLRDFTWPDTVNEFKETVKFLGGFFKITAGFALFIPIATILNYIIPGTGTAVCKILEFLGVEAGVEVGIDIIVGNDYNADEDFSEYSLTFLFKINVLIDMKFGIGQILKRLIGISIPFDFIKIIFKFRAGSGVGCRTLISPESLKFQAGVPYELLIKLGAKILFWSFGWKKKWDGIDWYPAVGGLLGPDDWNETSNTNNSNFDLDNDGVWDKLEVEMGLNTSTTNIIVDGEIIMGGQDSDRDGLWDGNELNEFFTDPLMNDSDKDGIKDKDELDYWYNEVGHDPFVDYDGDSKPCLLDNDSDNDFLKDGGPEHSSDLFGEIPGERTYGTDPSLPDTDFDGLLDGEEVEWVNLTWNVGLCDGNPTVNLVRSGIFNIAPNRGMVVKPKVENFYFLPDYIDYSDLYGLYDMPYGAIFNGAEAFGWGSILWNIRCDEWNLLKERGPKYQNIYLYWNVTNPLKKDTDEDGLIDGFEKKYYEEYRNQTYNFPNLIGKGGGPYEDFDNDGIINIIDPDSDNDGLLDGEEYLYQTDPLNMDTDGDGDTNGDGIINSDDVVNLTRVYDNSSFQGNFSDYWEIKGQGWPGYPWGDPDPPECAYPNPTPTNPLKSDSDDDGIDDSDEWMWDPIGEDLYPWPPIFNDSDADGLSNFDEYTSDLYNTDCTDNDTDDDWLLDGVESSYFKRRGYTNISDLRFFLNNQDIDNDGVLDGAELQNRTDPLNRDTDGDGLLDGREINYFGYLNGTNPLLRDTDQDGLLDGLEDSIGSNPCRKDTDRDGLTDSFEYYNQSKKLLFVGNITFKTNPCDPDTDGDGISDGDEVKGWHWGINLILFNDIFPDDLWYFGPKNYTQEIPWWQWKFNNSTSYKFPDPYRTRFETNPANPDTDNDGLNDGLEKKWILSPLTNDTDVDGIIDIDEINFMKNVSNEILTELGYSSDYWKKFHIWHFLDYDHDGLTDYEEMDLSNNLNDQWQLIHNIDADGDNLTDWEEVRLAACAIEMEKTFVIPNISNITNFNRSEINNISASQDWRNDSNYEYIDTTNMSFLYTDPLDSDTDDDGLLDGEELNLYGTNPCFVDSDEDGLTDWEEIVIYRTDPLNSDTDSDGPFSNWTDGLEAEKWRERILQSLIGFVFWRFILGESINERISRYLNDPDVDNDGIVDGVEFMNYSSDPLNTFDVPVFRPYGWLKDYDNDGLSDYQEFYFAAPGYSLVTFEDMNESFKNSEAYNNTYYNSTTFDPSIIHFINHTCYFIADTDDDGFSDGLEVRQGTDPLNANNYPGLFKHFIVFAGITEIDVVNDMNMTLKINTLKPNIVKLFEMPGNPIGEEIPLDVRPVGKYIDIKIDDPESVIWPIEFTKYYQQNDLNDANIVENQIIGMYYPDGTTWLPYKDIVIDTNDILINNRNYAGLVKVDIWPDQLSPKVIIAKPTMIFTPKEGFLYLLNRKIIPIRNTIAIGKIIVEVDTYNSQDTLKVEFYIDDELMFTDYEMPFTWIWSQLSIGQHLLKVVAYDKNQQSSSDEILIWKFF